MVAYYAVAEVSCILALGWQTPFNIVDLYVEHCNRTNGLPRHFGRSLVGALAHYGLSGIGFAEKEAMRQLAMRGGPLSDSEIQALLDYCEQDVRATTALLGAMEPFDLGRAILRGRYMTAVARMETAGIPIDTETLAWLRANWDAIRVRLAQEAGRAYTVTGPDGTAVGLFASSTFKVDRFECYLAENSLAWPRLASGRLDLSDDAFRQMSRTHQGLADLRQVRHTLAQLRVADLTVGRDGRNRCMLSPFAARTGRNQPSTTQYIFGPAVWLRGLIRPAPGMGVGYIDWSGQEWGIAAALSNDSLMKADYLTGDPYLAFAKHSNLVPPDATKRTHPDTREQIKVAVGLGAMYGAGEQTVATLINRPPAYARHLLRQHRERYPRFWLWRDAAVDHALLHGTIHTVYGWTLHVGPDVNPRAVANFPMQSNGAEMLRRACVLATEAGVRVCAPVHVALLIEAAAGDLDAVVAQVRDLMARASREVLSGFELRSGVETVTYPGRYQDPRGARMWDRVIALRTSGSLPTEGS
jgi:hypothetical protein